MSAQRRRNPLDHPLARAAGTLLSLAAIVWLALELRARWGAIDPAAFDARSLLVAALGAAVLGLSFVLQALNWRDLVRLASGDPSLPSRPVVGAAMRAQIGKYLPGNVAHLAARHLWLVGQGVTHSALGKALLGEIVVLLAAAGLVAAVALAVLPGDLRPGGLSLRSAAWVALAVSALAGLMAWRLRPTLAMASAKLLARAIGWMAILGVTFWWMLQGVHPVSAGSAIAAAVAGWAIGFATPGSPGGIGTREAAMTLLLSPTVPLSALLPVLALFRLVTVGADVVCYAAGRLVSRAGVEPATY